MTTPPPRPVEPGERARVCTVLDHLARRCDCYPKPPAPPEPPR